ncbi:MAG TPA: 4-hydroxybenzoate octaprenyltransferase [Thiomonas arsenitoxydans]|jgi:4-hydroxybenzoate polyprenyltransferase|uniref:4-hydroxybenzoate octaprenyltransferase n=1 Tax=Thiomonas intermedia (strain K12) TaxID=75379 RepID=D5WY77_THIK1|nr:4-hydroxybenzoate octaprenyltransferase [Thiomonas sp.]OZB72992.1 MAG: 4-hydroxybenzoate octaprenyltransferase [Thiomonas sp. 14-64-326]HOI65054.1 4-hydroxybenzoate octaprenyltransferase [Thiomonas arsenitoxydans]
MERLRLWLALIRWDKPVGSLLLLWPSLSALWIASDGRPSWWLVVVFIAGTFLMRSAGCAVNDVADRDFDRAVRRTAQRPVTSGKVSSREALLVGAALALAAFGLVLTTNLLTIQMSVAALLIAIAYPYTKRWLALPQAYLGVAFSFGIPMAFAAARGEVPLLAWVLLLGNLFWVLAYDTEYAMVDREDDLKVGIKTSAITFGRADVAAVMASYCAYIALWAAVGWALQLSWPYFLGVAAAAAQAGYHYTLIRERDPAQCFRAFRLNHYLGLAMFVGVVCAYAINP